MTRALPLFAAILLISFSISADARDSATVERIQLLEQQLDQQRAMIRQQQEALEAMQAELNALKAEEDTAPVLAETTGSEAPEPVETADPDDKNLTMEISGFVNLDMIYDFDRVAPVYESTLVPTTIPTEPDQYGTDGNFIASIKQSRLSFVSAAETPLGDARGWIEFDLFGTGSNAGNTAFNLRHAWFELGRWGAGQTWSTFMDISTWPNVYDWWGPSAMALNRNAMLRYTVPLDERGSHFAFALEKQNGSFNTGIFEQIAPGLADSLQPKSKAPDFIARWRTESDWGHFQAAGVARLLTVEAAGSEDIRGEEDEFGYGVNLTGIINVFGRDQVKYGLTWGKGIASFINDGGGSNLAPELNGARVKAAAMESWGYMLYYDHYWTDEWSSSIGLSQNFNDLTNLQLTNQPETVTYMSTNLFFTPSPQFVTGIEALYGELETADGSSGSDFRIQFTTRYNFSHLFGTR